MPIHLYAEHLINIRALSIQATLSTPSNRETRATLSADGSTLTLNHKGETAIIKLPVQASCGGGAALTLPTAPSKNLSFRVKLGEKPGATDLLGNTSDAGNVVPWSAAGLTSQTEIHCRECNAIAVERTKIAEWKDLPSEGWAEMMEFWHCHKPNEPQASDAGTSVKGYSADSKLAMDAGVGLIDPTSILVTPKDCQNISKSPHDELACSTCSAIIGITEPQTQSYRLLKHSLSISLADSAPPKTFDGEKWLACYLLTALENQGVRKFNVSAKDHRSAALLVWVFTPDLMVSSSTATSNAFRAVKVMWKPSPVDDFDDNVQSFNRASSSIGVLELPDVTFERLRKYLHSDMQLLPPSSRKFQDWDVALLRRFVNEDVN